MMRVLAFLLMTLTLALTACGGGGGGAAPSGGGATGNADRGKTLFSDKQCITCHKVASIPASSAATIGPPQDGIGTAAGTRKSGMTAEAYIRESIKEPNAFITPGFPGPPSAMILPVPVSDAEINDLVAFLMTLK
jgi:cytochrome c551/c552